MALCHLLFAPADLVFALLQLGTAFLQLRLRFGLGFERLLMFLTGVSNIRDVIPFARTPGNAEF